MAIHYSIPSMLQESLVEMVLVAEYCINFRKDSKIWGSHGCYGYPAAILLLAIADSIGSYVVGGDTRKHFDILKDENYYSLDLDEDSIDIIYKKYRCLLTHNAVIATDAALDIGSEDDDVFEVKNSKIFINILPFLIVSKVTVRKFLEKADDIVPNSQMLNEILTK